MGKFALMVNGIFDRTALFDVKPDDIPHKGIMWLPYTEQTVPDHTPNFQTIQSEYQVVNGNYELVHSVIDVPDNVARAFVVSRIKMYAQDLIRQLFSPTNIPLETLFVKEINVLARGIELLNKRDRGITLTTEEETEANSLLGVWDVVKSIRNVSNIKEQEVLTMTTNELKTYDHTANWNI